MLLQRRVKIFLVLLGNFPLEAFFSEKDAAGFKN
jgi:hypothetical protein